MRAVFAEIRWGASGGVGVVRTGFAAFDGEPFEVALRLEPTNGAGDDALLAGFVLGCTAFASVVGIRFGFGLLIDSATVFVFAAGRFWALLISRISSSFRIPCHPLTP